MKWWGWLVIAVSGVIIWWGLLIFAVHLFDIHASQETFIVGIVAIYGLSVAIPLIQIKSKPTLRNALYRKRNIT